MPLPEGVRSLRREWANRAVCWREPLAVPISAQLGYSKPGCAYHADISVKIARLSTFVCGDFDLTRGATLAGVAEGSGQSPLRVRGCLEAPGTSSALREIHPRRFGSHRPTRQVNSPRQQTPQSTKTSRPFDPPFNVLAVTHPAGIFAGLSKTLHLAS